MWTDLAGSIIVVTGGGSGIGRAVCQELANSDARLVIADLKLDKAYETRNLLKNPSLHICLQVDVSSSESVDRLVTQLEQNIGRCPNGVVNSAGIATPAATGQAVVAGQGHRTSCLDGTEEVWDKVIDTNLKGTYLINLAFARWMKRDKVPGSVVNLASVARNGLAPFLEYSASKAGVVGLTKTLAQELGSSNIRFNAVAPGMIETPMTERLPEQISDAIASATPLRRIGQPEEVAGVCCFLLSSKASGYVTGQVINVAGVSPSKTSSSIRQEGSGGSKAYPNMSKANNSCNSNRQDTANGPEDEFCSEFAEIWMSEKPMSERVEPSNWPPLVQPTEVKIFKPQVFVQG